MTTGGSQRQHADEIVVDERLVVRLLTAQFPERAALPLVAVASDGTDNAIFRLGDELGLRLPRRPGTAAQVAKEQRWLPVLAPHLPFPVPVPFARGAPTGEYPYDWTVFRWIPGTPAVAADVAGSVAFARELGTFVRALRAVDPDGGPAPGDHNFRRGVPLVARDASTRAGLAALSRLLDTSRMTSAWETALAAPGWDLPPVWVHGDLSVSNLLVEDGALAGVIDFGGLCVGDPACDLIPAWSVFTGEVRTAFRDEVGADDATWARGRGWALSVAVIALPYYLNTNRAIVELASRSIAEVLSDT